MAQQQMTSLFGPTPQDLLRQQQQADQELAMRQAQLGPGQGLMYQAASAGQRAGRNIAGLFGVEDPRLKEASAMQELKTAINTQWDGTDPVEAYKIMAKEAARLGLTQQSLAAAMQVKQAEEAKTKTGLEKRVKEAQIKSYEGSESRAALAEKRSQERFDYEKGQRAFEEAKKQIDYVKSVQDVNTRSIQAEAAQLAFNKAKEEYDAMPDGYFKEKYKLTLEKLQADINAAKALATYRERPPRSDQLRKMAEIPVRDDLGNVVGKTIVYSDGTQETVMGNPPAQGDVAAQTARGVNPNSSDFMEQLRAQALAERKRRQQAAGAK
jgi:hypothetical protein